MTEQTGAFFKKIIRFLLVGCLNTLVDFLIYNLMLFLTPDTKVFTAIAAALGYGCGIVCSFLLNKNWTFRDDTGDWKPAFLKFLLVNLASLGIKTLLITVLSTRMPDILFVSGENVAWVLGTGVTLILNFLGSNFFAFSHQNQQDGQNK